MHARSPLFFHEHDGVGGVAALQIGCLDLLFVDWVVATCQSRGSLDVEKIAWKASNGE